MSAPRQLHTLIDNVVKESPHFRSRAIITAQIRQVLVTDLTEAVWDRIKDTQSWLQVEGGTIHHLIAALEEATGAGRVRVGHHPNSVFEDARWSVEWTVFFNDMPHQYPESQRVFGPTVEQAFGRALLGQGEKVSTT